MTSENYRRLLNNEYNVKELTQEEFDDTLMHFAMLYHKEQLKLYNVVVSLPKYKVGQTLKRKSNYFNDFIEVTVAYIKTLDGRYNYRSSNGVWYSENELLAY